MSGTKAVLLSTFGVAVLLMCGKLHADSYEGFAEPSKTVELAAPEQGTIDTVSVSEGTRVSKGQLLVELDSEVIQSAVRVARAKANAVGYIDAAKAELKLRKSRVRKLRQLHSRGHAMKTELERAEADLEVVRASLLSAQEEHRIRQLQVEQLQAQLRLRQIHSPIDGVVVEIHREIGEVLLISDPRVITVVQLNPLRVEFSVSPRIASELKQNQKVYLNMSDKQNRTTGTVELVSPVMDAKSGTVEVSVLLDNTNDRFRSGTRFFLGDSGSESPPTENLTFAAGGQQN